MESNAHMQKLSHIHVHTYIQDWGEGMYVHVFYTLYMYILGGGGGGGGRGQGARGGICPPPPLKSKRPSSYTDRCVFMLPPKISRMCGSPHLVKLSEINPVYTCMPSGGHGLLRLLTEAKAHINIQTEVHTLCHV